MEKKCRIVIAEDHTILREGLRALLAHHPELETIGEAEDGQEAIRRVEKLMPDLLLMDLSMPRMSGMAALKDIKKTVPENQCHYPDRSQDRRVHSGRTPGGR
jgi:DNA-binding NarL/FixJ family response regulator